MHEQINFDLHYISSRVPGIILWKKNRNLIYTESNDICANLFGFQKPQDMIGLSDFDMPCEGSQNADMCKKSDDEVMLGKKPLRFIKSARYTDGVQRIMLINKIPLIGQNNIVTGIFAYCIDLTNILHKLSNLTLLNGVELDNNYKLFSNRYVTKYGVEKIQLTERQLECLFFLIRGKTAKEIAIILDLSPRTVECYIEQLKLKFTSLTKSELISKAIGLGFFNIVPKKIFETQFLVMLE